MTAAPSLLEVSDLDVRYGPAQALFGVSLTVARGEILALLGANGAGKSTFARAVSGLVEPGAGQIRFDGADITTWPAHRVRRAGVVYLPEGRGVFPDLSVLDNLRMAAATLSGKDERRDSLDLVYEMFPVLEQRARQAAGSLSGGEQQMLSLARSVAGAPKLIIADEMSLGLAPKLVDLVFEGLGRVRDSGCAIILIEQFIHRALRFADRCVLLKRGSVAWSGMAEDAELRVVAEYLGPAAIT